MSRLRVGGRPALTLCLGLGLALACGVVVMSSPGGMPWCPDTAGADESTDEAARPAAAALAQPANEPPVSVQDWYTTLEDIPLQVPAPGLLKNDTDPDGDPLVAMIDSRPAAGFLTAWPNGSFFYTPLPNYRGAVQFTYHAFDGLTGSTPVSVTITMLVDNTPPFAFDDAYSTLQDTALHVPAPGLLANDQDLDDDPLAAILDTSPGTGSLALRPDGAFAYTPALGFSGVTSFAYRVTDTITHSNVATVSIVVARPPAFIYLPLISRP